MKVIFHGHAFVEIIKDDFSIIIDPYISWNPLCDISLEEVYNKNIKLIVITHGHMDHIGDTPSIVAKTGAKVVSTYEVIQYLTKTYEINSFHSMHIGGTWEFEDIGKVSFVNAVHWNWVGPELLWWKAAWVVLTINWKKIYHAWDTALTYDMKLLESKNIDLAFLPIGDNFTMWIEDAIKAVDFIKPKMVVPVHYNTFDTIKQDPLAFKTWVDLQGIATCKILNPGEEISFD